MKKLKDSILKTLGKSHVIEMLEELKRAPLRFTDMERICRSKRTRSVRLRELEHRNLIKAVPKLVGHKSYSFYEITPIGAGALELGFKLLALEKSATNNHEFKRAPIQR